METWQIVLAVVLVLVLVWLVYYWAYVKKETFDNYVEGAGFVLPPERRGRNYANWWGGYADRTPSSYPGDWYQPYFEELEPRTMSVGRCAKSCERDPHCASYRYVNNEPSGQRCQFKRT